MTEPLTEQEVRAKFLGSVPRLARDWLRLQQRLAEVERERDEALGRESHHATKRKQAESQLVRQAHAALERINDESADSIAREIARDTLAALESDAGS